MESIIVYKNAATNETEFGIYTNISYQAAAAEVGKDNILFYIPLVVSGRNYQERRADLQEKAIQFCSQVYGYSWQGTCFSYGELSTIQTFFEKNGRRYGLIKEFEENGIC